MYKTKVLIIDDSLTARMKVKEALENNTYEILLAKNATEGQKLLKDAKPDLVVLDVVLPEMEGIELCKQWHKNPETKDIPVLLISGQREGADDRIAGLNAGAMGYIIKPFNPSELQAQVHLLKNLAESRDLLKKQIREAVLANKSKSAFLATMSHELRTPLTAIIGYAENIADPDVSESYKLNAVQTIVRNGQHLLGIINDILDFSKIESGNLEMDQFEFKLIESLNNIFTLMKGKALEKNLDFQLRYSGLVPKYVNTDETKLKQILINLISNAIKFTLRGKIIVQVSYNKHKKSLCIEIKDTGIGIAEDKLNSLFKAFTQADTSTTRKFGGSGLGLMISQEYAEFLGGKILVQSVPDMGSRFLIMLPVVLKEGVKMIDPLKEQTTEIVEVGENLKLPIFKGKVLVAEDGIDNQKLIAELLNKLGLKVTLVDNGQKAVEQAFLNKFDLILMDMEMPIMDGREATSILRSKGYQGAIIAISANAMKHQIDQCLKAGCNNHINKPFRRMEFIRTLGNYIDVQA